MPRLAQLSHPAPALAVSRLGRSRWSMTARSVIAALVVSSAAALVPLVRPAQGRSSPGPAVSPLASAFPGPPAGGAVDAGSRPSEPPGLPGGAADSVPRQARMPRTVLFIGPAPLLRPRGGAAKSFPCRATASLGWRCTVVTVTGPGAGAVTGDVAPAGAGTGPGPAGPRADVVVLVMTSRDDAASLARTLDAWPASRAAARPVILLPITVSASKPVAARLPAIRQLALARGADVIDPVSQHWVTAVTRRTYLAADGVQPTVAGLTSFAQRLAVALTTATV